MRKFSAIILLTVLFLVGFKPTRGASLAVGEPDSLPLRSGVILSTDAQKRAMLYADYAGAKELLHRSIAEDSTYSPAYYQLWQIYANIDNSADSALYFAEKAYLLDSLNEWYSEAYAQSLAVSGNYSAARRLYSKAIERSPQDPTPYVMVAMLYRESKMPHAAISIIDSAEMAAGKNSYLSSVKRDLLLSTGQYEKAIDEANSAAQMEPSNLEYRLVLAELYASTRQDSLARVEYAAAMQIDSTSVVVLGSLSQFQLSVGDYDAYLATLRTLFASDEQSIEAKIANFKHITSDMKFYARYVLNIDMLAISLWRQYPDDKRILELYTQHLITSGRLDDALEVFKGESRRLPADYDVFQSVIDIESYKQRIDSVELYTQRAIEIFPDRYELQLTRANVYAYTEQYKRAIESYRSILDKMPSDTLRSQVMGYIGDNYHQLSLLESEGSSKQKRQMRQAYKSYDKALEYQPTNVMVLNNYAYFLSLERRDLERALNMAGRVVALTEKNPTYLDTYAWILFELGRLDEAKKTMQQAIALDTTNSAELPFHYAEILAALGEDFMAEIYYEKALKLGYDEQLIESKIKDLK